MRPAKVTVFEIQVMAFKTFELSLPDKRIVNNTLQSVKKIDQADGVGPRRHRCYMYNGIKSLLSSMCFTSVAIAKATGY